MGWDVARIRSEEKWSTYIDVAIPKTEYSAVMEAVNSCNKVNPEWQRLPSEIWEVSAEKKLPVWNSDLHPSLQVPHR